VAALDPTVFRSAQPELGRGGLKSASSAEAAQKIGPRSPVDHDDAGTRFLLADRISDRHPIIRIRFQALDDRPAIERRPADKGGMP
jgi:hypothetical protein